MPPDRVKELMEWERLNKPRKAKMLARRKYLNPYLQELLIHFFRLSRRRQYGMAENPLLIGEMQSYANTYGYDEDYFVRVMSELDDAYLKFQADKRELEAKDKEQNAKRPTT